MTLLRQLVDTIEDEFHEYLDDTLINRLCKALLCRQEFHQELQRDFSETADTEWRALLKKASLCTLQDNPHQLTSIKILSSLLLSNSHCSHDSLLLIRQMLRDSHCFPILLEVINYWLQGTHSVTDLSRFQKLIDQDTCEFLGDQLHSTQNVYLRKLILNVLAHLALLGYPNILISDCEHATDLGILFLFTRTRVGEKYHAIPAPVEIPFHTWQCNFSNHTLVQTANMLYLQCAGALIVNDVPVDELAHTLSNSPLWSELCTQTLSVHFRHQFCVCGSVWDLVSSSWSEAVTSSLEHNKHDSFCALVKPIQRYSRTRLCNPPKMSDSFLRMLFDAAIVVDEKRCTSSQTCRGYLWRLFSIFITHHSVKQLGSESLDLIECRIENLLKWLDPIDTMDNELEAILHAGSEFCVLLSDDEYVYRFVHNLVHLVDKSASPRIALTVLQHVIALAGRLEPRCRVFSRSDESSYNMPLLAFNIAAEKLTILLSKQSKVTDEMYPNSDGNPDEFLSLMVTLTKLILERNSFDAVPYSAELNIRFASSLRRLFESTADSAEWLLCHSELRLLLAAALAHWIASVVCSQSATRLPLDQWTTWVRKTFDQLLDFDLTELLGSQAVVVDVVTRSEQKLGKVIQCHADSDQYLVSIASGFLERLKAVRNCMDLPGATVVSSPLCPDCGEVTDQLIQDIIIARPGSMITDCVEG